MQDGARCPRHALLPAENLLDEWSQRNCNYLIMGRVITGRILQVLHHRCKFIDDERNARRRLDGQFFVAESGSDTCHPLVGSIPYELALLPQTVDFELKI